MTFHYMLTAESGGERMLKVDHHFAKLRAKVECPFFSTLGVITPIFHHRRWSCMAAAVAISSQTVHGNDN